MGRALLGLPIPLLCYLLDAATAQSLEFVNPAPNALTALGDDLSYEQGEQVEVRWTSDFEATNVDVYQGEDGAYALESLGRMDKTIECVPPVQVADKKRRKSPSIKYKSYMDGVGDIRHQPQSSIPLPTVEWSRLDSSQ